MNEVNMPTFQEYENFFLFFTLSVLTGLFCKELYKVTGIPCAALILGVSVSIGYSEIIENYSPTSMSNEFFLHFVTSFLLPITVFSMGLHLKTESLLANLKGILVITIVGVLLQMTMLTGLLHYCYMSKLGFSLKSTLLLSVSLSIPDVDELHTIGINKLLALTLAGESLFGVSVSVSSFKLISTAVNDNLSKIDFTQSSVQFLALSASPFLGYLGGAIASIFIRNSGRDSMIAVYTTIITCMAITFLGNLLKTPGAMVIALTVASLTLSSLGKNFVSKESKKSIEVIWNFMYTSANYMNYSILGIKSGLELTKFLSFSSYDLFFCFLVFAASLVLRFLTIWLFRKMLPQIGNEESSTQRPSDSPNMSREVSIVTICSTKGELCLCLGLFLYYSGIGEKEKEVVGRVSLVFVFVEIFLSKLILKMCAKGILTRLQVLVSESISERFFLLLLKKYVIKLLCLQKEVIFNSPFLLTEWNTVKKLSGISEIITEDISSSFGASIERKGSRGITFQMISSRFSPSPGAYYEMDDHRTRLRLKSRVDLSKERYKVLCEIRGVIWSEFKKGGISLTSAKAINTAIDVSVKQVEKPMKLLENLERSFHKLKFLSTIHKFTNLLFFGRTLKKYLFWHVAHMTETISFLETVISDLLLSFNLKEANNTKKNIFKEMASCLSEIKQRSVEYELTFQHLKDKIDVILSSKLLLNKGRVFMNQSFREGLLSMEEHHQLLLLIEKKMMEVDEYPFDTPIFVNPKWVLESFRANHSLSNADLFEITKASEVKMVSKNSKVELETINGTWVMIVISGVFYVKRRGCFAQTIGVGAFLSYDLIVFTNLHIKIKAISDAQVLLIPKSLIDDFMENNSEFRLFVIRHAVFHRLLSIWRSQTSEETSKKDDISERTLAIKSQKELKEVLAKATASKTISESLFGLPNGGYLISGSVQTVLKESDFLLKTPRLFSGPCFIEPQDCQLKTVEKSEMLVFPENKSIFGTKQESKRQTKMTKSGLNRNQEDLYEEESFDEELHGNKLEEGLSAIEKHGEINLDDSFEVETVFANIQKELILATAQNFNT